MAVLEKCFSFMLKVYVMDKVLRGELYCMKTGLVLFLALSHLG